MLMPASQSPWITSVAFDMHAYAGTQRVKGTLPRIPRRFCSTARPVSTRAAFWRQIIAVLKGEPAMTDTHTGRLAKKFVQEGDTGGVNKADYDAR